MQNLQVNYIVKAEKQLLSFREYSYTNYTRLWEMIEDLRLLINTEGLIHKRQDQLDLAFEMDEQLETLKSLRYVADKNEEFALHVQHTLNVVARIKPYLSVSQVTRPAEKQHIGWFDFLKRFSLNVKHAG